MRVESDLKILASEFSVNALPDSTTGISTKSVVAGLAAAARLGGCGLRRLFLFTDGRTACETAETMRSKVASFNDVEKVAAPSGDSVTK